MLRCSEVFRILLRRQLSVYGKNFIDYAPIRLMINDGIFRVSSGFVLIDTQAVEILQFFKVFVKKKSEGIKLDGYDLQHLRAMLKQNSTLINLSRGLLLS